MTPSESVESKSETYVEIGLSCLVTVLVAVLEIEVRSRDMSITMGGRSVASGARLWRGSRRRDYRKAGSSVPAKEGKGGGNVTADSVNQHVVHVASFPRKGKQTDSWTLNQL